MNEADAVLLQSTALLHAPPPPFPATSAHSSAHTIAGACQHEPSTVIHGQHNRWLDCAVIAARRSLTSQRDGLHMGALQQRWSMVQAQSRCCAAVTLTVFLLEIFNKAPHLLGESYLPCSLHSTSNKQRWQERISFVSSFCIFNTFHSQLFTKQAPSSLFSPACISLVLFWKATQKHDSRANMRKIHFS